MKRVPRRGAERVGRAQNGVRVERDPMGELEVPAEVLHGIQTERARRNFQISGLRSPPALIRAVALIKVAAARANMAAGELDRRRGQAIVQASLEVADGRHADQFVVDAFQAGAGTSLHMNVNEVVANRAEELLGGARGQYRIVHPNDHVNMAQSTNDVVPTAMRLAALELSRPLLEALSGLARSFARKGKELDAVVKSGRTHLRDAAPIRLGQELSAYGHCLAGHGRRIEGSLASLRVVGLGGSAVGTGLNVPPGYRAAAVKELSKLSGEKLESARDSFEAMQSMAPLAELSGALRNLCLDLIRICNDLRLLSSGPSTGFGEIELPAVQPGSSIMPGKVNPAFPEMATMVCFQVCGNDLTVALGAQAGQLELNVMMPGIAHALLSSMAMLAPALKGLDERCVAGICADVERARHYASLSPQLVTALAPRLGYAKAAELAKQVMREKRPVLDVVIERGLLQPREARKLLDPRPMTEPGRRK